MLSDHQIQLAKKRIWNRMEAKLQQRGVGVFQTLVSTLKASRAPVSSLRRVQLKEHLLDFLPERAPAPSFLTKRLFAGTALLAVFGVLFMPVLTVAPSVSAAGANRIEAASGEVFVNEKLVSQEMLIQAGDQISTADGAMAHVFFLDDSRITLGPNTRVDIVDTRIDPDNHAKTQVEVRVLTGRVWVQVLNLVGQEDTFTLDVPEGSVNVDMRASFDVEVDADTHIGVARNLVHVRLVQDGVPYEGVLGQGAELLVQGAIASGDLSEEAMNDVWWDFNLAYGKSYARQLDEDYKKEAFERAVILPGNPLYFLKTFRETLQVSFAFSETAKQELLVQQAENRLNEAQVLLAQGETAAAEEVLETYQNTVEESLQDTDNEAMLAMVEETQKQVSVSQEADENVNLLEGHLTSSSAMVSSDVYEKSQLRMLSATQKLERVPDLIANGDFNQAFEELSAYQADSLSVLTDLEGLSLEEREVLISAILDQKLRDIQLLRVIASMPELQGMVDINDTILEQLGMMVLSLREKELSQLSDFFESTQYSVAVQYDLYSRLKNSAEITPMLTEQFKDVEDQLSSATEAEVLVDIAPTQELPMEIPVEDPRFIE